MSFDIGGGRDEKLQLRKPQKTIHVDNERGGDTPEKHSVAGIFDEIPVGILQVRYAGVKGVGKIKSVCKTSWDRFGGDSNSYS